MALIVIENLAKKTIQIEDFSKTLLRHFQEQGMDWMQACGGKGRCTTCSFQVLKGFEYLQPKTQPELNYEKQNLLQKSERLACQAKITGDITICVPNVNKLPHVLYSH